MHTFNRLMITKTTVKERETGPKHCSHLPSQKNPTTVRVVTLSKMLITAAKKFNLFITFVFLVEYSNLHLKYSTDISSIKHRS